VLLVRCPACQNRFTIEGDKLGTEITCPTEKCALQLKINPFVIKMS
jgi:hypothetical protein